MMRSIPDICKHYGTRAYYPHGDLIGIRKAKFYHWYRCDQLGVYRKAETTRLIKSGARMITLPKKA